MIIDRKTCDSCYSCDSIAFHVSVFCLLSEINTVLLLSGVTASCDELKMFGFRPDLIMPGIGSLVTAADFQRGFSTGHSIRNVPKL